MPTADRTQTRRTRRRFHRPGRFDGGELEVAPWVPSRPPPPPRRGRRLPPPPPPPPSRRSPLRGVAVSLALGVIVTGTLTLVGGLPLTSIGPGANGHARGASAAGSAELPGSQAIIAASGPVHPVRSQVDYGDREARFGASRYGHTHEGQDMFAKAGTPLVAVRDATVIDNGNDGGRGNYVAIYSESEDQTYVYLHMLRPSPLRPGDDVTAGEQVGQMGCTGSCWGTHLHFEVRLGRGIERKPIDPLPLLQRWPRVPE
jgi:murein DD-endopeptidase MepM/ murein hydrolase activator NlpD